MLKKLFHDNYIRGFIYVSTVIEPTSLIWAGHIARLEKTRTFRIILHSKI